MRDLDYVVAVPSYRRAPLLRDATLRVLAQGGVAAERVHVFVADDEERQVYERTLAPGTYGSIIVGVPTLRGQRGFIHRWFPDDTPLFSIDDDIRGFYRKAPRDKLAPVDDLHDVIVEGFTLAREARARLWGIYPVLNGKFMQYTVTRDLRYIVGCAWGVFNTALPELMVELEDKEDFERTLKFYVADGTVVRVNYIAPKTRYYSEPGGMQVTRTPDRVRESAEWLARRYPQLCELNLAKKSGHAEVRLRDKRKVRAA